jgi:hypothetical protein
MQKSQNSPNSFKRIPVRMGPDFCPNCKRTQHSLGILHCNLAREALADFLLLNRLAPQAQRAFSILPLAQYK